MLWYGTDSSGTPVDGVSTVGIATSEQPDRIDFAIDTSGESKAGEQWRAAAWTAAAVGSLLAATDPRGVTVSYHLKERMDGPSGGAILTAGTLVALDQQLPANEKSVVFTADLPADGTMTGTVLPSGAVGLVGGIPAKLRAAAKSGITTVLIPQGQQYSVDPVNGQRVNVQALAGELGITVHEVSSIRQGTALLTGQEYQRADAETWLTDTPRLSSDALNNSLAASVTAGLRNLQAAPLQSSADPKLAAQAAKLTADLALARSRIDQLVSEGRFIDAWGRTAFASRAIVAWNAEVQAFDQANLDLPATKSALLSQALQLQSAALSGQLQAVSTPVQYLEQAIAVPDATCWAVDAWVGATTAVEVLPKLTEASDLGLIAAQLARLQFDLTEFLPFSLATITEIGKTPLSDPQQLADIFTAYTRLMKNAGEGALAAGAQVVVNDSTAPSKTTSSHTAAALAEGYAASTLARLTAQSPLSSQPAETQLTTLQQESLRLAQAISFYVSATTGSAAAQINIVDPAQSSEMDRTAWSTQIDVASQESAISAAQAQTLGLDTTYLAWNEGLGRVLAIAPNAIGADPVVRLNGLQLQWYGNVQGRMLVIAGLAFAQ